MDSKLGLVYAAALVARAPTQAKIFRSAFVIRQNQEHAAIVTECLRRFQASPHMPVRRLSCRYSEGVLTLVGSVSSFFHKQMAQHFAGGVQGVERIDNQVEVI